MATRIAQHFILPAIFMGTAQALVGGAATPPVKQLAMCPAETKWRSMDHLSADALKGSAVTTLAHTSTAIIAAGYWMGRDRGQRWGVRRSADGGKTWATVEDGLPDARASAARAAAVGPEGEIYVAGSATDGARRRWMIRKSTDDGQSWKTLPFDSDAWASEAPNGLAVDSRGVVYAIGVSHAAGQSRWLVLRSEDGGQAWSRAGEFDLPGEPQAIAATSHGEVYVGGGADTWTIRYSPDGVKWRTVDHFRLGSELLSRQLTSRAFSAAVGPAGEVAFTGSATDDRGVTHWITRSTQGVDPERWATVDDFDLASPGVKLGGFAAAFDSQGELFVTGTRGRDFLTRSGYPGAPFVVSDALSPRSPVGALAGTAMTIDASGMVFAGGSIASAASPTEGSGWLVRRLECKTR